MFAFLRDDAVLKHDDHIGIAHGGKTVRDDDGRALLHEGVQRLLHRGFGDGVQCGGRFVQHQDTRILEDRAGDGDSLLLPAGEAYAVFADLGIVAFREFHDELVRIRHFRGFDDLRVHGVFTAVFDVVLHRSAEKERFLKHDADILAERFHTHVPQVHAVDFDAAGGHVEETHQQAGDCRLARTGRTDKRDFESRLHFQGEIPQNRFIRSVAETDIREFEFALCEFQFARRF